jgi:hypothetical protein
MSALNNRTNVYNLLLGNKILGEQSIAKLCNNRTAVLRNSFPGNGSINTLPRITQQWGLLRFLCSQCDFCVVCAEGLP